MKLTSTQLVFFSPTQTTERVLQAIAQGLQTETVERLDLTRPAAETAAFDVLPRDAIAVIGAPVYGGRIPDVAVRRLARLRADHTPAVLVVAYGNRAYEDALLELQHITTKAGFRPVSGGAFIGEHSFDKVVADGPPPVADGRPDGADLAAAIAFGKAIRAKTTEAGSVDELVPLRVPGNTPYRERGTPPEIAPVTLEARCDQCGECADGCPTAAITIADIVLTDVKACILCSACVKRCPTGARVWEAPRIRQIAEWLSANFSARQEPEIFL